MRSRAPRVLAALLGCLALAAGTGGLAGAAGTHTTGSHAEALKHGRAGSRRAAHHPRRRHPRHRRRHRARQQAPARHSTSGASLVGLGSPFAPVVPAGDESPQGVVYSPVPLATQAATPCRAASSHGFECETLFAPTAPALAGAEFEGSGPLGGYTPQELRSAYKLPEHGGAGMTVAIVDGPGDPHAEADMNVFRKRYGLGECTEANGCFEQVNQFGERTKPTIPGEHWTLEISLDLDMVSSACQECHIVLVEALEESQTSSILMAEETAIALGANVISNSWNVGFERGNPANSNIECAKPTVHCVGQEEEEAWDSTFDHPGTPIFFAGGDYGYAVRYPAISQYVISVGGTTLKKEASSKRGWTEETWYNTKVSPDERSRGGGSGCSLFEPKPKWQLDKACTKRIDNDVAAVANAEVSPVTVYDSYFAEEGAVEGGYINAGGTSAAAPLVAGIWALSSSYSHGLAALGAEAYYRDSAALNPLTKGINGTCTPPAEDEYWCTAGAGYNGPGGNGTPNGPLELGSVPTVVTGAASGVTASQATLHGTVDPNGLETTYHFEYGSGSGYEASVPVPYGAAGSATSAGEVSQTLSGLAPATKYHYRLVATNATGTTDGAEETLTTAPLPIVTNVQANAGPVAGGVTVAISGSNLAGATAVKFGSTSATSFTEDSASLITAVVPAGSGTVDVTVTTPNGTSAASAADRFTYRQGAVAVAWGENAYGQLGNGNTVDQALPIGIGSGVEASAIADGYYHGLAVKSGVVAAAGDNEEGQLGNATTINSDLPVIVCAPAQEAPCTSFLTEVSAVAAGKVQSYALLKNGSVDAWGYNGDGELGNGSTTTTDKPVAVTGLTQVTQIAAGANFGLALLKNGTVEAWGEGKSGQLGDGKTENSTRPTTVCAAGQEAPCKSALSGVIAISADGAHALALLKNGTVMSWGEDKFGQVGNGTKTAHVASPVQVSSLSGVTAVAAGENDSLALLASGTVEAWGADEYGQLGNGGTTASSTPVSVSGLSEVAAIAHGSNHNLALLRNGTAMAWGQNNHGQLGEGSASGPETCSAGGPEASCSTIPRQVSNLSGVIALSGGAADSLALGSSPVPTISALSPSEGPPSGGTTVTIAGAKLAGASEVKFGAAGPAHITASSQTSITAVAPEGNGTVPVTVTTPAGTSVAGSFSDFSYVIPVLSEGLGFSTPVERGQQMKLQLPAEGGGFSFGQLKVTGAVGETAKLELESKPAFVEVEPEGYVSTGQGIDVTVGATDPEGRHLLGPVSVACKAPASITVGEMPIVATAAEGTKQYSTTYNAECVLWPGGWNVLGTAKATLTVRAPESVYPGERVEPNDASFTIVLPLEWTEWLYLIGGRAAHGSASGKATAAIAP